MVSETETLSVRLARWAAALGCEDLPPAVVHQVKRSLLDYLGVTIRGSTTALARTIQAHVLASEGGGRAAVIGTAHRLGPAGATLANGTAAAVLELDDVHTRAGLHAGATCIPAVLAMAEARGASDRDVIVAVAAAGEVAARIGIATHTGAAARGFHCTPLVGVFGAAIGVGRILGSDARAMTHALGLAGSHAGGLFDYHGGWLNAWCVNAGRAGREGLLCASLAACGIEGPVDIFDGPRGFAAAFAGDRFDRDGAAGGLGRDWVVLDTAVKIHPCCRRLHSPIDAVLALKARAGIDIDAIDRIVVETSAESARLDYRTFDSTSAAQMSIPYGVACAIVHGAPELEHFEQAAREDPRVLRLVERVELRTAGDPAIADPGRHAARVGISAAGVTASATVAAPTGDPANPVGDDVLERKFRALADPVIGSDAARRLVATVWALDRIPETDGQPGLHFLDHCAPARDHAAA